MRPTLSHDESASERGVKTSIASERCTSVGLANRGREDMARRRSIHYSKGNNGKADRKGRKKNGRFGRGQEARKRPGLLLTPNHHVASSRTSGARPLHHQVATDDLVNAERAPLPTATIVIPRSSPPPQSLRPPCEWNAITKLIVLFSYPSVSLDRTNGSKSQGTCFTGGWCAASFPSHGVP